MTKKLQELRMPQPRGEAALSTAHDFLRHLAAGQRAEARALASPNLRWFGRKIEATEWQKSEVVAFFSSQATSITALRTLERELLSVFSARELDEMFDGDLDESDQVVLADIRRGAVEVTAILVVSAGRGRPEVARVVDPGLFQQHLRSRSASA